ncbi:polysaccharide deacetylase family protein [Streptomyces sp. NBC_00183]|uniref:polysaccharide deacetylase family protein n=1 Tax=unclassified Streptomyces TaxID=2593676 RepID=UPI00224D580B|nr:polysaccharide deacetylase family protein [Streptomyces sp. NBC_00183]MCX5293525.1 polysaccharide deacetylase family protein [Streptomyces sp. NBC_00183]
MRLRALAAGALALVLLTGCAQSVDPIERLGAKAAQRVRAHGPGGAAERPYRRWGLTAPLLPAPKPSRAWRAATETEGRGLPPVVSRIRTRDKVVFLTYDDGADKDPRFVDMVRELRLPVSMFLTDSVAGPGYGHFARLQSVGASIQNHTLGRPTLRGLPYAGQRAQICGQQDRLRSRFGIRPRLFRPPYGAYDPTTRRAAADCGISALVLWRASMTGGGDLAYLRGGHGLRPGDIVAVDPDDHSGPKLRERTARLLRRVQRAGLTVGRLEDYV